MIKRIGWVDIFRGLAIIAIVIGHSGSPIQIHHLVYSFHIAAFLFISGYTFNPQKDLMTLVIDRTKRLLVPYFSYNLFSSVYTSFLNILRSRHFFMAVKNQSFILSCFWYFGLPLQGWGGFCGHYLKLLSAQPFL
jgi:fucose 4-O-acetylase-like acetyltransferase